MKSRTLTTISILIVVAFSLGACIGQKPPTKVIIAMDATFPPFEYIPEGGTEINGFDADLIKAIAEKENLNIELVNVPWDPLLEGMKQCQYDAAISAMTINEERKGFFNFTDPYFAAGQVVTVRSEETGITGKFDLSGKKVGVQFGTTGETEARKVQGTEVKTYDGIGLAFEELANGEIDAVIADNLTALDYLGAQPGRLKIVGEVFTDEFYGIAVCKTNTVLLGKLNSGLAKVKSEGLIEQLSKKWIEGN